MSATSEVRRNCQLSPILVGEERDLDNGQKTYDDPPSSRHFPWETVADRPHPRPPRLRQLAKHGPQLPQADLRVRVEGPGVQVARVRAMTMSRCRLGRALVLTFPASVTYSTDSFIDRLGTVRGDGASCGFLCWIHWRR